MRVSLQIASVLILAAGCSSSDKSSTDLPRAASQATESQSQVTSENESFRYRLNVNPGDKFRYRISNDMPEDSKMHAILVQEVESVKDNKFEIISYYEEFRVGSELPESIWAVIKEMRVHVTLDQSGRSVSIDVKGGGELGRRFGTQLAFSMPFPDKALKPGDTWEEESQAMGFSGVTKYKFEGLESLAGKRAAVISFVPPPLEQGSEASFKMWIDADTGMMIRLIGTTTNREPKFTSTTTFERIE
jgi:hypothetical protein